MTSHGQRIEGALPLATIGRVSTREAPIAKSRIATPPEFAGMPPVNPSDSERPIQPDWKGSDGLAGDVRYYGQWVRRQALKRIGHLYPSVTLPPERGGGEATATAWLWARTVKCPSPACGVSMPLLRSFWLSTGRGQLAWVEPRVGERSKIVGFEVMSGEPPPDRLPAIWAGTAAFDDAGGRIGASHRCLACGAGVVSRRYVGREIGEGRSGWAPLAILAYAATGAATGWTFVTFDDSQVDAALRVARLWVSESGDRAGRSIPAGDAPSGGHSPRQVAALTAFSDAVLRARAHIIHDQIDHYSTGSSKPYATVERDIDAYASAVVAYLALLVDANPDRWSGWGSSRPPGRRGVRASQVLAEANPFGSSAGSWTARLEALAESIWTT